MSADIWSVKVVGEKKEELKQPAVEVRKEVYKLLLPPSSCDLEIMTRNVLG